MPLADKKNDSKGKKRTRSGKLKEESPDAKDSTSPPPAKKQKDGQKARSENVIVPIDEGCTLKGWFVAVLGEILLCKVEADR